MLVATSNPDAAKVSPYECGMNSVSDARQKFQVSFFLVALLFIVFDSEILFLYPFVVSLYQISSFGFWVAMVFILILTIGFVYELGKGALDYSKFPHSKNSPKVQKVRFQPNKTNKNKRGEIAVNPLPFQFEVKIEQRINT